MSDLLETSLAQHVPADKQSWLQDFRVQQLEAFLRQGFPTRKNELWKYTEIKPDWFCKPIGGLRDLSRNVNVLPQAQWVMVFVNGHFSAELSRLKELPEGVIFCSVQQALVQYEQEIKAYLLQAIDEPFARLNSVFMQDGCFLKIPKNKHIAPLQIVYLSTQQNNFMINPRNIIAVDQHSHVTLIETYLNEDTAKNYLVNTANDFYLRDNAEVNYYKLQDENLTAAHIGNINVYQQRDSKLTAYFFSKGSNLERETVNVWQQAAGAESHLYGFYAVNGDQQHVDHHLHIDHRATQGKSSMIYKGIINKKSRAVFNGKVYVHEGVKQIDAHQENHNLLLSKDAEVNSKPELEIYSEDVKCTHGATIGQLDDEALFYLRSRGIAKQEANQLLIQAFAEEVYDKIEHAEIRQYLHECMGQQHE